MPGPGTSRRCDHCMDGNTSAAGQPVPVWYSCYIQCPLTASCRQHTLTNMCIVPHAGSWVHSDETHYPQKSKGTEKQVDLCQNREG